MLHAGSFCSVISFIFICLVYVGLFSEKEFMFAPTPWSLAVLPSTCRLCWRDSCFLTGTMLL